jgi:polysaccharide deacetylase family protein (PEP-CTERM system associated)
MLNVLSIDVEEYFHPAEVGISASQWLSLPSRIEFEVANVLELLEKHRTTATFFILGWVAEHHPRIVREIARAGHEIGCHSHLHRLVYDLSPEEFREDTERACCAIEDASGVAPRAYRAPCFSITARSMWALEILVENGFTHDSSIYPIAHDRYGIPGFGRHAQVLDTPAGPIQEVPVATVMLSKQQIAPVGGGGYLRLLPYRYMAAGIRRINEEEKPACIYFHPWELDPDQPRLASGMVARVRTYYGLSGMKRKMEQLLSEFRFSGLGSVHGQDSTPEQCREGVTTGQVK